MMKYSGTYKRKQSHQKRSSVGNLDELENYRLNFID